MNVFSQIKLEPYGFSHGDAIGFKLYGIDAGHCIDFKQITLLLEKRKGSKKYNTTRDEAEQLNIKSGFENNVTNGQVIWIEIEQSNFRSSDYEFGTVRPGHADLSAYQKYGKDYNYSGGGQFSGRLTILYVIAGEIARQILSEYSAQQVLGHVSKVGNFVDTITDITDLISVQDDPFPMADSSVKHQSLNYLAQLKGEGDSVGGQLDIYIARLKENYGDDFFGSLESKIAFLMYSIPAVKAVEFGLGVGFATALGSQVVEQLVVKQGKLQSATNFNGGINGGIANLITPIHIKLTVKPTSSIFKELKTVKYHDGTFENATLNLSGRHDSFIANRALWPAIGLLNLLFLDLEMENNAR